MSVKNRLLESGQNFDYTPASAVTAGELVRLSPDLVGVPANDIEANALGTVHGFGIYTGRKVTGAITQYQDLWWNPAADPVSGTAGTGAWQTTPVSGGTRAGIALQAAGANDATVTVLLCQPGLLRGTLENLLTDPGNAGAIPVLETGTVRIVTTGAQTRTLAAPSFVGQELLICMQTDGGDAVITCATGINQTGNNTITLNDAGDSLSLVAIQSGSNLRWRVVYNDGCTLATV